MNVVATALEQFERVQALLDQAHAVARSASEEVRPDFEISERGRVLMYAVETLLEAATTGMCAAVEAGYAEERARKAAA